MSASAAESLWVRTEQTAVRLISSVTGTGGLESAAIGLHFKLRPGWKTYWRAPGEGGYPPGLEWEGSDNLAGVDIAWPTPKRFSILGIDSIGYTDEVVLPMSVRLRNPGQPLTLRLALDYLTCEKICVPQSAVLTLDLPAETAKPSPFTHLIDRYRGRVPGPPGPMLSITGAEVVGNDKGPLLRVTATAEQPFGKPDLFVDAAARFGFGAPKVTLEQGGRRAIMELSIDPGREALLTLTQLPASLTLRDGTRAIEQNVPLVLGSGDATGDFGFLTIIALALLGGLILNLMPCVLPVLSIKLLGLVGHGGGEVRTARFSFIATAAGIVVSFLLLASVALAIKAAGLAVGWGIQFQQPVFLAAMTVILVVFACNLWGMYEIRLPGWLDHLGAPAGDDHHGLVEPFLTGMLATLLATPCSAPFLGTAVGFALSRGALEIYSIFLALGLGLALPYLAVAAVPRLVTMLPRPGPWMVWLRRLLGLALVGTGVWLVSILITQAGATSGLAVSIIGLAVIGVLWLRSRLPGRARAAAVAVLALLAVVVPAGVTIDARTTVADDTVWQPFDRAAIPAMLAQGKTVFVDVTADWCITCQFNKATVLNKGDVALRLSGPNVIAMRADWTKPSDEIADYLASFGRYGIPFNAVYGPEAPWGIALPEFLTNESVLTAFKRAAGSTANQRAETRADRPAKP